MQINKLDIFFKKNIILATLVLVLGFCFSCKEVTPDDTIEMVTPEEVEELSDVNNVKLIDVRTEDEFNEEHIQDAQNIVYDKNFSAKLSQLNKDQPLIVYCNSGNRSEKSAQILKDSGFVKVYDLKGGITEWKYRGKETKK
ncbi:rhodanese-like domain-containing protein [Mesonia aestuariivivens]|uniref:Rhodanese-like domain-containing protein n=1 Tax=Mesonia aestuariivivens TaxID=2796128 RepID=A0ABS6VZ65_9FLAO|nr:rhodanese-like domain-containing protein [Mesonia aestuariivivens]MBW2960885.1 rhodanese-like domain-containing protein [Mesonia aestuariivivens]